MNREAALLEAIEALSRMVADMAAVHGSILRVLIENPHGIETGARKLAAEQLAHLSERVSNLQAVVERSLDQ